MKKLLLAALLYLPLAVCAQKQLIKTGKLFNSETGKFETGMDVLVDGTKIVDVKADKDVTDAERAGYKLVDLSKYTVLPGLIDCHTHLLNKEEVAVGMDFSALSMEKQLTMRGDAYRAIYGSVKAKAYLEAGITAVQDLGNSGQFGDIALRRAINEKLVTGPRMRCSGPGLASEGGQLPGLIYKHRDIIDDEYRIVKGADDATQAVRENVTQGADVIKIYSNNTPNRTALSVEEMRAIVKEAHRYGVRVTAHATDNAAVYNAVIAGVDGIEHGYEIADTTLALMAKKHVILIPTDGDKAYFDAYFKKSAPGDKENDKQVAEYMGYGAARLKRAIKQGVTIAYGSDDYIEIDIPLGETSKHTLIGYSDAGVAIPQVLQFATVNASKQLNWSNRIGIIKKDFLADIIAVDNNLDTDIHAILNVHFVMKGGVIYVNK